MNFILSKDQKFYNQLNKEGNFNVIFDVGTNKDDHKSVKKINSKVIIFGFEPNDFIIKNYYILKSKIFICIIMDVLMSIRNFFSMKIF